MEKIQYHIPLFWQKVGWIIFRSFYFVFLGLKIEGRENLLNISGPVIIAPNHTSELDATLVPATLPFLSPLFPIYFATNPEEKYKTFGWRSWIYGSFFFNMLGGYSVFSGHHNYEKALETHHKILKSGGTVCIFAEGKRTKDGMMNPARGGLGYLIWYTKATVIPVSIDTLFHLSPWEFFTFGRKVTVTIGKPIKAEEIIDNNFEKSPSVEDFRSWAQKVLDRVKEKLN